MSKETIYRHVWRKRGTGSLLCKQLKILSKFRRKRRGSPAARGSLLGKPHISERPERVQQRAELGHWEGDTEMGSDMRHCVLTLVERVSGYVRIKKLGARSMELASAALRQAIGQPGRLVKTITLGYGAEFHDYKQVEPSSGVKFYFVRPYHSSERGTNENTNGLIRQYLPKGRRIRHVTQTPCNGIATQLNNRPRLRLPFKTPSEVLAPS